MGKIQEKNLMKCWISPHFRAGFLSCIFYLKFLFCYFQSVLVLSRLLPILSILFSHPFSLQILNIFSAFSKELTGFLVVAEQMAQHLDLL